MSPPAAPDSAPYPLPRVTIQFCTQCRWMLRAAYYAQELLSTFSLSLGEVALQPATGGVFVVAIHHRRQGDEGGGAPQAAGRVVLWDRKVDGGFPETKELKRRVRDVIEPGRDLGHVDRDHAKEKQKKEEEDDAAVPVKDGEEAAGVTAAKGSEGQKCEDCAP